MNAMEDCCQTLVRVANKYVLMLGMKRVEAPLPLSGSHFVPFEQPHTIDVSVLTH